MDKYKILFQSKKIFFFNSSKHGLELVTAKALTIKERTTRSQRHCFDRLNMTLFRQAQHDIVSTGST